MPSKIIWLRAGSIFAAAVLSAVAGRGGVGPVSFDGAFDVSQKHP